MNKLVWQGFKGSTKEFRELRSKILDEKGELREEYIGMDGYARFAEDHYARVINKNKEDEHYAGDMQKAFINVSAVLDKDRLDKLAWQGFNGLTTEYRELRSKILDEEGEPFPEYIGMEGYARFADEYYARVINKDKEDEHYAGDMHKAFKNVSAVLGKAFPLHLKS